MRARFMAGDWMVPYFTGIVQSKGRTPGLTRDPGEGGPRIVQPPLSSGLRPRLILDISRRGHVDLERWSRGMPSAELLTLAIV